MDAFDFLRAKARMCRVHRDCAECPADGNCVTGINTNSSNQQIEKVVAIVERWAAEHPQETRLSKLLRQYPKAKAEVIKEYCQCPIYLGYSCPSPKVRCRDCWDTPIEEEQQE